MKQMKKLNKMILGLSVTCLIASCDSRLDVEPTQSVVLNEGLKTARDVQITLVGTYNLLGDADVYGGRIFLEPDLLATRTIINWSGTYQELTQIANQDIPANNDFVANLWLDSYKAINQANTVLSATDKVDSTNRDRVEGEAKFLRGMLYFDLVRLFGKAWNDGDPAVNLGVPLILVPTDVIDPSAQVPRNTVAQVYEQAISDLTEAENLLPETNTYYANKYAAAAILSRVYLQQGDYQKAAAEASKVIESKAFSLTTNFENEFPYPSQNHVANTSEDIFAIQVTTQQGANSLNEFYASSDNGGRGDIEVRQNFINEYEEGDARANFFYDDGGAMRTAKFNNLYGNVHIVRLAEMYLTRAEANWRLGTSVGAAPLNDVNQIRERAGLRPLTSASLNDILKERRLELAFEGGFFLHDAKRLQQNIGGLPFNSPKLVFPIPQREIYANPSLIQNEGY